MAPSWGSCADERRVLGGEDIPELVGIGCREVTCAMREGGLLRRPRLASDGSCSGCCRISKANYMSLGDGRCHSAAEVCCLLRRAGADVLAGCKGHHWNFGVSDLGIVPKGRMCLDLTTVYGRYNTQKTLNNAPHQLYISAGTCQHKAKEGE
jgi:hypothetical protein